MLKLIGVGMGRTGTTSTKIALELAACNLVREFD